MLTRNCYNRYHQNAYICVILQKIEVFFPKWMVYKGKPTKMDDLEGKPIIFGNIHI